MSSFTAAPSSSSSVSELVFTAPARAGGPAGFIQRSLDILREEQPDAFGRLCGCLEGRVVRLAVDEELMRMEFGQGDVRFIPMRSVPSSPDAARPCVDVATGRRAILDLVDGKLTLMSAVLGDELVLRGSTDNLLAFHDGLFFYLHGAVRAPTFPDLLDAFRRAQPSTPVLRFGSHA